MSFHRVVLVALATLFSIAMTSFASAGCCGLGYTSPVVYAASVGYGGYGGYGGCCGGPTAAAVYAQPMAPAPIVVSNPVMVTPFGGPCCGWSGCGNCGWGSSCGGCGGGLLGGWGGGGWGGGWGGGSAAYVAAPYVVNQGPTYSGPGLMQPYATYSPDTAYAPAADYPYVPGNGNGYGPAPVPPPYYSHLYYHPHYAYRAPLYAHPRSYAPQPHYYYGAPQWRHYP
jgi:hypothetical protein